MRVGNRRFSVATSLCDVPATARGAVASSPSAVRDSRYREANASAFDHKRRYNHLRLPLPPKIPPSRPRAICRPSWLLAARIALLAMEVANES